MTDMSTSLTIIPWLCTDPEHGARMAPGQKCTAQALRWTGAVVSAAGLVQGDCRRIGHVKAFHFVTDWNECDPVATLAYQTAYS